MLAIWIRHEMKRLVANREMIIWIAMYRRWNEHNEKSIKQIAKATNAKNSVNNTKPKPKIQAKSHDL